MSERRRQETPRLAACESVTILPSSPGNWCQECLDGYEHGKRDRKSKPRRIQRSICISCKREHEGRYEKCIACFEVTNPPRNCEKCAVKFWTCGNQRLCRECR